MKTVIEEQRLRLGYGTHQVLFNVDLYGKTSGTYTASVSAKSATQQFVGPFVAGDGGM